MTCTRRTPGFVWACFHPRESSDTDRTSKGRCLGLISHNHGGQAMRLTPVTRVIITCLCAVFFSTIVACGGGGGGGDTPSPVPGPTSIPSIPANFRILSASGTSVSIAWDPSPSAMYYNVYRSTSAGSGYSLISSTPNPSYSDSGLDENTTYYYQVAGYNPFGEGARSAYIEITTGEGGSAPNTPSGLTIGSATS